MLDIINIVGWFLLLGLLPGFVLMGLFRLKDINWGTGLLYIIGLSLVFDMVAGLIINVVCPLFGLFPFHRAVMFPIWLCIMGVFTVVALIYMERLLSPYKWDKQWIIVGIIYVVSVALIYQTSLLTDNLIGSDIHQEYFYAQQTILNGFSDVTTYYTVNVCLPISILVPMYSVLSGLDMIWVFKAIQPLVFAVLPLILYELYKVQFGKVRAVIAVIFFVALPFFTMDVAQLVRQQYAMIFFALVTLVLISRNIGMVTKVILASIFGIGVVISHYGVGTGFMGYMLIGALIIPMLQMKWLRRLWGFISRKSVPLDIMLASWRSVIIWIVVSVVCIGGGLLYYKNIGSGVAMDFAVAHPVHILESTIGSVWKVSTVTRTDNTTKTDVVLSDNWQGGLDVSTKSSLLRTAVGFDFAEASSLGKVWRIIQYIVELCLIIGLVRLIIKPISGLRREFLVFTITSVIIVVGMYVLPISSWGMGATRELAVTLMFLSPFFVIGVETITEGIVSLFKVQWKSYYLIGTSTIVLIPYILFNSGVVFEMIKSTKIDYIDIPYSLSLSSYRLDIVASFSDGDLEAIRWLKGKSSNEFPLFGDAHACAIIYQYNQYISEYSKTLDITGFCTYGQGYVFLRSWNVEQETLTAPTSYGCRKSIPWLEYGDSCKPMKEILEKGVVVFDNGARIIKVIK